jgi:hypothetical protein
MQIDKAVSFVTLVFILYLTASVLLSMRASGVSDCCCSYFVLEKGDVSTE